MSDAGRFLDWSLAMFDPSLVTDELLASLDIAEVNLACAKDLPGAEELDFDACVTKIDEWSDKVRHATSRNYFRFLDEPQVFEHSLGKFYMAVLCTTLQRECGGFFSRFKLYQQLDVAIHCCAKKQGTVVGPGTGKKPAPAVPPKVPGQIDCNQCGAGPTRPIDCSGY